MPTARDLTGGPGTDAALRQSEENLRSIFMNSPVGIFQSTMEKMVTANPTLVRMFGYQSFEEMIGNVSCSNRFFVQPDQRRKLVQEAMASGAYAHQEVEYRRKDGSTFIANLHMRAVLDQTGEFKYLEGFVEDMTQRKRAEAELLKASQALEQIPVSIVIADLAGNIEYINPKFTQMTGYSREEAIGKNPRILKSGKTKPEEYRRLWKAISSGHEWRGEFLNKAKDGRLFWESALISPIVGRQGQITHYLAVKEDITQRKQLEEQLRQAQKMEAVGQLAGGVAHDFNNILAASLMQLSLLQQEAGLTPEMRAALKDLEDGSNRAASLTRQLLLFSRRQVMEIKLLEFKGLLGGLVKMLRRLLGEHVELILCGQSEPAWVNADVGMMEQVVTNLCINARDAMPEGGELTITTANVEFDAVAAAARPDAKPGKFVCLSVADTGCGMNEATLKQVFEPFFTTKGLGKGTGLGLATVFGIVKQHQGWIEVESEVGVGSVFRVFLPARVAPPGESSSAARAASGGREMILVVEDNDSLRMVTAQWLQRLGYQVLAAANGQEALQQWNEQRGNVALLLTDMMMPGGMSGLDLAQRLKGMNPALKVIISTGYSLEIAQRSLLQERSFACLAKPYEGPTLAAAVRHCLEGA
jgi:PAS domain S-box-containing protein